MDFEKVATSSRADDFQDFSDDDLDLLELSDPDESLNEIVRSNDERLAEASEEKNNEGGLKGGEQQLFADKQNFKAVAAKEDRRTSFKIKPIVFDLDDRVETNWQQKTNTEQPFAEKQKEKQKFQSATVKEGHRTSFKINPIVFDLDDQVEGPQQQRTEKEKLFGEKQKEKTKPQATGVNGDIRKLIKRKPFFLDSSDEVDLSQRQKTKRQKQSAPRKFKSIKQYRFQAAEVKEDLRKSLKRKSLVFDSNDVDVTQQQKTKKPKMDSTTEARKHISRPAGLTKRRIVIARF